MSFESMIAMRYVRARRQNSFISFISLVSIVGIALGVAALIIVLSVMNGFQKEIRTRMLGVASHLEVSSVTGQLNDWPAVQKLVAADPRVEASAPFIAARACCQHRVPYAVPWFAEWCRSWKTRWSTSARTWWSAS